MSIYIPKYFPRPLARRLALCALVILLPGFCYTLPSAAQLLYSSLATPIHHMLTAYRWPSALAGAWANTAISRWCIPSFIKAYQIDMTQAVQPLQGYQTFNEFFSRKLVAEARPVDTADQHIISPGDGNIIVIQDLGAETLMTIKKYTFALATLLDDEKLATQFIGGTAFILRISPNDYHRFHAPVSGLVSPVHVIHGRYESVQPYVFLRGIQPLEVNERHVLLFETDQFGTVAYIPVGALFVGSMGYTYTPGQYIHKGDEVGYFCLGGSTIVMLFQPGIITSVAPEIQANSAQGLETAIKMAQCIAYS
jgi:phosphatidylserine decarboxylase